MTRKTLEDLYREHKGKGTDKWLSYLAAYDRILAAYRDKPIRLLEIGVQNGGSLEIWSEYFLHAETIVGCDIVSACGSLTYDDPCISVIVGDITASTTETAIADKAAVFDLIIDDGSHRSSDIIKTFLRYFPRLEVGGSYIVEDLHCSYWEQFEGGLFDPFSAVSFFKRVGDVLNHQHWGIRKERVDILRGFFTKYGLALSESDLSTVQSVEFLNSICVIRKQTAPSNDLGPRFVAGTTELVCGNSSEHFSTLRTPPQDANKWSTHVVPPDEAIADLEREVAEKNKEIEKLGIALSMQEKRLRDTSLALVERESQIEKIYSSHSWRITAPMRRISHQIKRIHCATKLLAPAIRRAGGSRQALQKALSLYRREGFKGIQRGFRAVASAGRGPAALTDDGRNDYAKWIRLYDTPTEECRRAMQLRLEAFVSKPTVSVLMPTFNTKVEWLEEAIESVRRQLYPYWELCIADDASTDPSVLKALERYSALDSRIKVVYRSVNGHISAASNTALDMATGEWTALLDHDDVLSEYALFWVVDAINTKPNVRLIYSDEDKLNEAGERRDAYFKCDWNYDLFLSQNLISHLGVYSTQLLRDIGGFRTGFEGSQDWDIALRCIERFSAEQIHHVPRVLYHWRIHSNSTAAGQTAKPYAYVAAERALNEHLQRKGVSGRADFLSNLGSFRVRYDAPALNPKVSVVIPTRDRVDILRQCITSVLGKTDYSNYEMLIIDNGSSDKETLRYLRKLKANARVRVLQDDQAFNFSALNNRAVREASGEFLLFLNNDTEVKSAEWLTEMLSIAAQPGVGAVGARLWYPDNTLQHGGVILGLGGIAGHGHLEAQSHNVGYFGRAALLQSLSAVTAACMLVRKSIFEQVGGFDESLKVAFNDVDLCLRIAQAGYRNVWTPYAELYHYESATRSYEKAPGQRERFQRESEYMRQRWASLLQNDPAYSPNLTLEFPDFSLAWPPRVSFCGMAKDQKALGDFGIKEAAG